MRKSFLAASVLWAVASGFAAPVPNRSQCPIVNEDNGHCFKNPSDGKYVTNDVAAEVIAEGLRPKTIRANPQEAIPVCHDLPSPHPAEVILFIVEGACRYGGGRTKKGWRIWVSNTNRAAAVRIMVTPKVGVKSVRQIQPVERTFPQLIKTTVGPGDTAVYEI